MNLAAHFTAAELGNPPPQYLANAQATAELLENVRTILGVPLRVTSGWRSDADNARVGGSATSGHLTARAADFVPIGMSLQDAARKMEAAKANGQLSYGEVIYYPTDGHIHITLPGVGGNGEALIKLAGGGYSSNLTSLLGGVISAALLFFALVFLVILRKASHA